MTAIPRLAAVLIAFSLAFVPSASAEISASATAVQQGGTLTFSGSMHVLDCTNGNANMRIMLKEPAGGYVQIHPDIRRRETLVGSGKYVYRSISFDFSGSLDIGSSWPTGEYEIVADGYYHCYYYYNQPVTWIGDIKEGVRFTVSGSGPSGWEQSGSSYTSSFTLEDVSQASLSFSAHQSADCWVNGHKVASGASSGRIDITGDLQPGSNEVACNVNAGYEKVCGLWDGASCGCHCWSKYSFCGQSTWFWDCPSNVQKTQTQFFVVAQPSFSGTVALHRPEDVLWSSDGSSWLYSRLPVTDDTMFLDRPDYYSGNSIYQGQNPWSGGEASFIKWLGSTETEGTLAVSALLEPGCELNGEPVNFELVEDDWWVFQANVSLLGINRLACSVEGNGYFNLFDASLLKTREEGPAPLAALPAGSPFQYDSGSSEGANTTAAWLSQASSGFASFVEGAGQGASSIPAVPIGAAAATAVAAVGLSSHLARRKRVPKGTRTFWDRISSMREKYLSRKGREEEFNNSWASHLEATRRYWKAQEIMKKIASQRIALLSGQGITMGEISQHIITLSGFEIATGMLTGAINVETNRTIESSGAEYVRELIYTEMYRAAKGKYLYYAEEVPRKFTDVENKTIFINATDLDTDDGMLAKSLSMNGYYMREAGEVMFTVGFDLSLVSMATVFIPPVSGAIAEVSKSLTIGGAAVSISGLLMKQFGDITQYNICAARSDEKCMAELDVQMENNVIDISYESMSAAFLKVESFKGILDPVLKKASKSMGKSISKFFKEINKNPDLKDRITTVAENAVDDQARKVVDSMKKST
jgi:hypothetical protein